MGWAEVECPPPSTFHLEKVIDIVMKKFISFAHWGLVTFAILFWIEVISRIVEDKGNHIGYNILNSIPLFLVIMILPFVSERLKFPQTKWPWVLFGALSILGVGILYQFNILLPYDVWIQRHMPPRPF